jgi:hypothetical protein
MEVVFPLKKWKNVSNNLYINKLQGCLKLV